MGHACPSSHELGSAVFEEEVSVVVSLLQQMAVLAGCGAVLYRRVDPRSAHAIGVHHLLSPVLDRVFCGLRLEQVIWETSASKLLHGLR